jgi:hypothetical protein
MLHQQLLEARYNGFCSVVVITPDSDSGNPGSSPGKTFRSLSKLEGYNLFVYGAARLIFACLGEEKR